MTSRSGPILVVEDIPSVRDLMRVQLELQGYTVLTARDGQEALDLVAKTRPAAILTDILMPRVDGFALAHQLRSNPRTAMIPIIFLSATYVSAEDERFAMDMGASRFLQKPINVEDLFSALRDALERPAQTGHFLPEREFYLGYQRRLTSKFQQREQQIARMRRHLSSLPVDQRATYQQAVDEAEQQRAEIQNELDSLTAVLNNLG